uniref:Histone H2A n=1 Tax=Hydatigena taeniaeformis TaxID=6205 RepID=A0A0R3WQ85_HYDTA
LITALGHFPTHTTAGMSGRGKARKPAGGKKHTKSARAGLVMPVGRVHRYLKLGRYARRTSTAASVYLSAVIEYLVAEVNELSGNAAKANKRLVRVALSLFIILISSFFKIKTITPRHIMLGVRNDAELNELLKNVHISHGGVLPCIHPSLLKRKSYSDSLMATSHSGAGGAVINPLPVTNATAASSASARVLTSASTAAGTASSGIASSS